MPADDDVDNVAPPAFIFRFKLGDSVETRPDTQPGVRGYHGESFVGSVAALDYTTRFVTIKSCHNGHMHPAVHENRVYPVSRAINGNDFRFTRAVDANPSVQFQRELDKKDRRISKQEIKIAGLQALVDNSAETIVVTKSIIRQLRTELILLRGEIGELEQSNAIFLEEIRVLDSSSTSAREIFSRNGPSSNATPVIQAIRSIYLEKLSEVEARDESTKEAMDELKDSVDQLTLQLKTEVKVQIDLKRVIRALKGENKRQAKVLDDTAAATALDEERDTFENSMDRRLQYVSRCSSYTTVQLLHETYNQTFINNERRQLGIEQGVLNAWKLASAKYYREFFNDGSDKNGVNIMCTSLLVEYANGENELIIRTQGQDCQGWVQLCYACSRVS